MSFISFFRLETKRCGYSYIYTNYHDYNMSTKQAQNTIIKTSEISFQLLTD